MIPLRGLRTLKWRTKTVDPRQWDRQAIVQPYLFVGVCEIDREQVAFHRKEVHRWISHRPSRHYTEPNSPRQLRDLRVHREFQFDVLEINVVSLVCKMQSRMCRKVPACSTRRRYSLKCIPYSELQIYARRSTFFGDSRFSISPVINT